jgi:hypothetical protein
MVQHIVSHLCCSSQSRRKELGATFGIRCLITGFLTSASFPGVLHPHLPTENTVVSPGRGRPFPSLERP